jgi:hypothetical protein
MSGEPPQLVSTDDVLPAALVQILTDIRDTLGVIVSNQAGEQAQLNDFATAIQAAADHVNSASGQLAAWISANSSAPLDFTGASAALASLQAADSTLQATVPQAPATPLADPVPDPGPAPAPVDTTGTDTGAPPPDSGVPPT